MIIEDEENVERLEDIITDLHANAVPLERGLCFNELMASTKEIENMDTHYGLRGDLIEHLWVLKGAHMA